MIANVVENSAKTLLMYVEILIWLFLNTL